MATVETAWKKSDGPVRYHKSETGVELGDRIEVRGIIRRRRGIVNSVPGISEPHPEMEFNALYWVGISFDNGTFTGVLVDPDTGCVLKKVVFLGRGSPDPERRLPDAPFE
jgi:hypothetical protein